MFKAPGPPVPETEMDHLMDQGFPELLFVPSQEVVDQDHASSEVTDSARIAPAELRFRQVAERDPAQVQARKQLFPKTLGIGMETLARKLGLAYHGVTPAAMKACSQVGPCPTALNPPRLGTITEQRSPNPQVGFSILYMTAFGSMRSSASLVAVASVTLDPHGHQEMSLDTVV